jgi:SAM-dependent methyltransferase
VGGRDHPMRAVTRDAALRPDSWTAERAASVEATFDTVALTWDPDDRLHRTAVVTDALTRGVGRRGGLAVESGSGTGLVSAVLAGWFDRVVAVDISWQMLVRSPPGPGLRVQADGARLPVAAGRADALVMVNALLFPGEADRVLRPGGAVVFVCTLGDDTPIYLSPDEVEEALAGWRGVAAEAGWGTWAVFTKP